MEDRIEIVKFMNQYSFATIITIRQQIPVATHLPFVIEERGQDLLLSSHFAKANDQWKDIEQNNILVIFSEPHAYISPSHYEQKSSVPTWNYIAVHTYGSGSILHDLPAVQNSLSTLINKYEAAYGQQWNELPQDYKSRLINGIVAFEIKVTKIEAKKN